MLRAVGVGMWLLAIAPTFAGPLQDRAMDLRLVGCPVTVDELPPDPRVNPGDVRLRGPALIVVLKDARRLVLYSEGELKACYWVGLANGYVSGHKQVRGDLRTPEGWQRTSDRPWSTFYAALSVHYPMAHDAQRGFEAGLVTRTQRDAIVVAEAHDDVPPAETKLGGRIVIHGGGGRSDWTLGCVGLEDADIDALRERLPDDMRTDLLVLP